MSTQSKTHGLANSAKKKRQATFDKVDKGIQTLIKNKGIISFKSVAETAGVSKAWLYKKPAVKQRIQQLQAQQQKTGQSSRPIPPSDHSLRALNDTLRDRIKRLEHDNRELRQQNHGFAGHLLRVRELEKHVQRLEAENQRLMQSLPQPLSLGKLDIQLEALGVQEGGLQSLIQATYELLGLRTYFTTGPQDTRAWTIKSGMLAPQAAGVIHTDFERGFIRAETVGYDDLVTSGSMGAAKEKGLVRSEGKEYTVKEGDVMLFRFNV